MVRAYDTLELGDVYGAMAYYLSHGEAVRDDMKRREEEATALRADIEARQSIDADEVQKRLLAAASRLRGEVAASITRKKTPKLLFQVVQFVR